MANFKKKKRELKAAIIHEIRKDKHKPIGKKIVSKDLLDIKQKGAHLLFNKIAESYGVKGNHPYYGTFEKRVGGNDVEVSLSAMLGEFKLKDPKKVRGAFLKFSKEIYDQIYEKAGESTPSTGGYIFISIYKENNRLWLMVGVLKPTDGISIENLMPKDYKNIDTTKLYQVARVNIGLYEEYQKTSIADRQNMTYMSFLNPSKHEEASGYFIDALGCSKWGTSKQCTMRLLKQLDSFMQQSETLKGSKKIFIRSVSDKMLEASDKGIEFNIVEVVDVAKSLFPRDENGENDELVEALEDNITSEESAIPSKFLVDESVVSKKRKIKIQSDQWTLDIDSMVIGTNASENVYFDEEGEKLVFSQLSEANMRRIIKAIS